MLKAAEMLDSSSDHEVQKDDAEALHYYQKAAAAKPEDGDLNSKIFAKFANGKKENLDSAKHYLDRAIKAYIADAFAGFSEESLKKGKDLLEKAKQLGLSVDVKLAHRFYKKAVNSGLDLQKFYLPMQKCSTTPAIHNISTSKMPKNIMRKLLDLGLSKLRMLWTSSTLRHSLMLRAQANRHYRKRILNIKAHGLTRSGLECATCATPVALFRRTFLLKDKLP